MGLPTENSIKAELHQFVVNEKFDVMFADFFDSFDASPLPVVEDRTITLIARSVESTVAQAVLRHADQFCDRGMILSVIWADIEVGGFFGKFRRWRIWIKRAARRA